MFKVEYFNGKFARVGVYELMATGTAFLAQSPQLAKQMCIAGDMERVYEIAPGELFIIVS